MSQAGTSGSRIGFWKPDLAAVRRAEEPEKLCTIRVRIIRERRAPASPECTGLTLPEPFSRSVDRRSEQMFSRLYVGMKLFWF